MGSLDPGGRRWGGGAALRPRHQASSYAFVMEEGARLHARGFVWWGCARRRVVIELAGSAAGEMRRLVGSLDPPRGRRGGGLARWIRRGQQVAGPLVHAS